MTIEDKLRRLRILLDEENEADGGEEDNVLLVFLDQAKEAILKRLYPLRDTFEGLEVPDKHENAQLRIAAYLMDKRGAEGQIQHIENGIHRNYGSADIPDTMLTDIVPFVGFPK